MKHQIARTEIVHMNGRQMKSSKTQHIHAGKVMPQLMNPRKGRYADKLRSAKKAELTHEIDLFHARAPHPMANHDTVIPLPDADSNE